MEIIRKKLSDMHEEIQHMINDVDNIEFKSLGVAAHIILAQLISTLKEEE